MKRVVVTGIGLLTAVGQGVGPSWDGLLGGRSGIGPIAAYDASSLRTRIGAEIPGFDAGRWLSRKTRRMTTRNDQLAVAGAAMAVEDAGLSGLEDEEGRVGLYVGGNKEVSRLDAALDAVLTAGDTRGRADFRHFGRTASSVMSPLFYVEGLQGASLFYISQDLGIRGPNAYVAGTADAGATAVALGMRAVRRGEVGVAVVGGFDDAVSWWSMAKMDALGVLSDRNELGAAAFRPFDRERSGSVLGEGAAFLVLEELSAARRRGARVYAELRGAGMGADSHGVLAPCPAGRGLAGAIGAALADGRLAPPEVRFVATHGCATAVGDITETRALRTALGPAADDVMASSVKPQTGHLVAGAGALNVAVAALAVASAVVPPTLHLEHPDPECDLDWVPGAAREVAVPAALALARGLQGQATAVALSAVA